MRSNFLSSIYHQTGNLRIGILGGSFNPAHGGHREISLMALKRLNLDQVWWLITPQNPLKSPQETKPISERVQQALKIADHPKIMVSTLEQEFNLKYTYDTVNLLNRRFNKYRFILLIGADNLQQMSRWYRWQQVCFKIPMAVFARPGYSFAAVSSKAGLFLKSYRLSSDQARNWWNYSNPAWVFFKNINNPSSSTKLRQLSTLR